MAITRWQSSRPTNCSRSTKIFTARRCVILSPHYIYCTQIQLEFRIFLFSMSVYQTYPPETSADLLLLRHKRSFCLGKTHAAWIWHLDLKYWKIPSWTRGWCLTSGPEGHRSAAHWQTGRSVHAGPGGDCTRTHGRQLSAGTDHPLQRDASPWVHSTQHHEVFLSSERHITDSQFNVEYTETPWTKQLILYVFFFLCSWVSDQALWSRRPEGSDQWGISLSSLHGVRSGRRI